MHLAHTLPCPQESLQIGNQQVHVVVTMSGCVDKASHSLLWR